MEIDDSRNTPDAKNFALSSRRDKKKGKQGKRFKQFAMIS
jgi:hypothetical protein